MSIITYSAEDLATGLGCKVRWVIEQARQGKIPARRIAKQWRFTEQDCTDILALCANGFHQPQIESPGLAVGLTEQSRRRFVKSARLSNRPLVTPDRGSRSADNRTRKSQRKEST